MATTLPAKLLEIQKVLQPIIKDAKNPHFGNKYFDVNSVLAVLKPLMNEKNLLLQQPLTYLNEQNRPCITTIITDVESKETISFTFPLPDLQDPQKMGSVITYYRRYALVSLFLLESDDDDGNGAGSHTQRAPMTSQPAPRTSPPPFYDEPPFDGPLPEPEYVAPAAPDKKPDLVTQKCIKCGKDYRTRYPQYKTCFNCKK